MSNLAQMYSFLFGYSIGHLKSVIKRIMTHNPLWDELSKSRSGPPWCLCHTMLLTLYFWFWVCSFSGISFQSKTLIDQLLTSPNYPSNYPPLTNCLWSLKRPSTSYVVRLTFKSFYLASSPRCTHNYVEIRDGDRFSINTLIGKFCGSRVPPIIVSRYTFIFVMFASDSDYYPLKRNFHATFRAIVPGRCKLRNSVMVALNIPRQLVRCPLFCRVGRRDQSFC